jgi:N-acyl-L-homoserine lactone synthetase
VRKYSIKRSGEELVLEVENVFKIAVTYFRVREFLTSKGWEFQGKDEEMEIDSFRNKKTGKKVLVEDISEIFQ